MRAVLQRVGSASVSVAGQTVGQLPPGAGLLVYVGIAADDSADNAAKLAEKVANLRIFEDDDGRLNLSVLDVGGGVLVVPNFTLQADTRKGRRPAFVNAAPGQQARPLHEAFIEALESQGVPVRQGRFGAEMRIVSEAIGPVNVIVDIPAGAGGAGRQDAAH
ncbi:MAG: D-aminoacyl-tRNA deacylase [Phycisphaerae bacterium]